MCLEWLAAHDLTGDNVLDYGCGSGILALAAVKLGARHAFAVDHDAQALQAARDNARKNTMESRISAVAPHELPGTGRRGRLLSSILCEQVNEVSAAYRPWCDVTLWAKHDGWACLEGVRKSAMV